MSSSSSTAAEDDAPELPGFYYDREKKKYFRLIPGHNNHNPLTSAGIRKAKHNKMNHNHQGSSKSSIFQRTKKANKLQQKQIKNMSLNRIIQERIRGSLSSSQFARQSILSCIQSNVQSSNIRTIDSEDAESGTPCNDNISRMLPSQSGKKLVCVRKDSNIGRSYLCHISKPKQAGGKLRQRILGNPSDMTVEDMCYYYWSVNSRFANEGTIGGHTGVLSTAIFGLGNPCLLFYPNVDRAAVGGVVITKVIQANRNAATRKCAFNSNPVSNINFSLSVGKKVIAVYNPDSFFNDVDEPPSSSTFQLPESSYAQHFSTTSAMLFNGLRNGQVVGSDLRTLKSKDCQSVVLASKKVCQRNTPSCIRTLRNGRSVLVYYKGCKNTLCMWDLRNTAKPLFLYFTAENNLVMHRCQDFFVDEDELFLTCVSQDGFLKIFDVNSGHCATSMTCFTNNNQTIGAAHYNNNWSIFNHTPGVFGVMRNSFAWIPFVQ